MKVPFEECDYAYDERLVEVLNPISEGAEHGFIVRRFIDICECSDDDDVVRTQRRKLLYEFRRRFLEASGATRWEWCRYPCEEQGESLDEDGRGAVAGTMVRDEE